MIVYKGQRPLKRVNFDSGTQKIGRLMQCEIAIEDVDIALEQATLFQDGSDYFLEPLSFNPPTMIEGEEVRSRTRLGDGDVISIGPYRLIFSLETDPVSDVPFHVVDSDNKTSENVQRSVGIESDTIVVGGGQQERFTPPVRRFRSAEEIAHEIASASLDTESKSAAKESYCLLAISGPFEGEIYDLHEGENVIGTSDGCDIRLNHDKDGNRYGTISAAHASVTISDEMLVLLAYKSRSGTACNGKLLPEGQKLPIRKSDEIEIRHAPEGTIFRLATRGHLDISPPTYFKPATYADRRISVGIILAVALILLLIVVVILAYK